jgi:hypothetical protein
VIALGATLALTYGATVLMPGFWASAFGFQVSRERVPALARLARLATGVLPESGPILLAGLAGSFLLPARARAVAWLNLVGLPVTLFVPPSFFPHYLSSFGPGLALAGGALVAWMAVRGRPAGQVAAVGIVAATAVASGLALKEPLTRTTPHLFGVVDALRRAPEPILCLEPIYAHWAGRRMTRHFHVADLRYALKLKFTTLDDAAYLDLVSRSQTVLVDPNLMAFLTPERTAVLVRDFVPVYRDSRNVVLVRRTALPEAGPPTRGEGSGASADAAVVGPGA